MSAAPLPAGEAQRLAALHALNLLDTPADARFDVFVRLASELLEVPISAFSLVDAGRQWFKAQVGLPVCETSRDVAFCAHAVLEPDEVLVVPDATADPRFADNPLVTGEPGIRFYAGIPLAPGGQPVGTLCVIDTRPRVLSDWQLRCLHQLGHSLTTMLEMHSAVETLGSLAAQDPLTGCGNRAALDRSLARFGEAGPTSVAVFCLDLDGFKSINDLLGHAAGDAALVEVARRLRAAVRPGDVIARLGGDEFVVIAPGVATSADAGAVAARFHAALAAPHAFDGQPIRLRGSVGVALCPRDAETGPETLRLADAALYAAKRAGRGVTRIHGQVVAPAVQAQPDAPPLPGRDEIGEALRAALGQGDDAPLAIAWQPIFWAGAPDRLRGAEALVRWPRRPGEAPLSPGDFLPVAERLGLMARLDRWVLRAACREAVAWPVPLRISVNISAANFLTLDLRETVERTLAETRLPPQRLTLEVTESALILDMERARTTLEALRAAGISLALDDFGTGHSSLAYLRDLPFDKVKIDRSFTAPIAEDDRARALLRAIVQLCRTLGLATIAEGVETTAQLAALQAERVDGLQGFLLGRPGPAAGFLPSATVPEITGGMAAG